VPVPELPPTDVEPGAGAEPEAEPEIGPPDVPAPAWVVEGDVGLNGETLFDVELAFCWVPPFEFSHTPTPIPASSTTSTTPTVREVRRARGGEGRPPEVGTAAGGRGPGADIQGGATDPGWGSG